MQEPEPQRASDAIDDDPGGSADRADPPGRDLEHLEEQSPDDFEESEDEVSHG